MEEKNQFKQLGTELWCCQMCSFLLMITYGHNNFPAVRNPENGSAWLS